MEPAAARREPALDGVEGLNLRQASRVAPHRAEKMGLLLHRIRRQGQRQFALRKNASQDASEPGKGSEVAGLVASTTQTSRRNPVEVRKTLPYSHYS